MVHHPPSTRSLCAIGHLYDWSRGRDGTASALPADHRNAKTLRPFGSDDVPTSTVIPDDPYDEPEQSVPPQPHQRPTAQSTHIQWPARGLKGPVFLLTVIGFFLTTFNSYSFFFRLVVSFATAFGRHTTRTCIYGILRDGSTIRTSLLGGCMVSN